jgi:hypothetical protein
MFPPGTWSTWISPPAGGGGGLIDPSSMLTRELEYDDLDELSGERILLISRYRQILTKMHMITCRRMIEAIASLGLTISGKPKRGARGH